MGTADRSADSSYRRLKDGKSALKSTYEQKMKHLLLEQLESGEKSGRSTGEARRGGPGGKLFGEVQWGPPVEGKNQRRKSGIHRKLAEHRKDRGNAFALLSELE